MFHSRFCPWNAASARLNEADFRSMICVAARVSPRVSASSSGMRTAAVEDCVENASSAPVQSSPLAWVTTANEVTSTELGAASVTRSSWTGSQVAPGSMYVSVTAASVEACPWRVT